MCCCTKPCARGPCGFITLCLWWTIGGGAFLGVIWYLFGIICCIIPGVGEACRKVGCLCFDPLSKEPDLECCDGVCCMCENICNCVWLILCGWELFLFHTFLAILCLPFMLLCLKFSQIHWKLARISLWPVGAKLHKDEALLEHERHIDHV